ncbi:MAG: MAPEG family protein [Beijerinckiaceae bacterium]|nr:MAPEG family protein [Beijerinckiaceae bacterium]
MAITSFYASLLALLFVVLSVGVIRVRRGSNTSLGDGGDATLLRAMRVQGNFAEYVPLGLLMLGLAESLHTNPFVLHALGLMLLCGRLSHAYGVSRANETFVFRVTGMGLTLTMLICTSLVCLLNSAAIQLSR